MVIQTTLLPLAQLAKNDGQIEGLPANPRIIKDEKYQKLVASIKENPEMLSLRELLVYKHDAHYIIIGGNMRYSAMRELGYEEAPCKIIPEETTVEQLRAYTLKDNSGYGEWDWDMLSGEWEMDELEAAGIDLPFLDGEDHPTNNEAADIEEDDFDETTDEIKTRCQSGDIWLLGQHKLICGDSTKESDIERLLGKEMADGVTGGGLHGKDLSKADVSVNIFCHIMAQKTNRDYKAVCAIGDEYVNGIPYAQIVSIAKNYIDQIGGFEKFAEWGLV